MFFIFKDNPIFKKSVKLRPVEEIVNIQIFRPLAHFASFYSLRTMLDNLDGQLASCKNQTSILGRYPDTLMDYI